MRRRLYYLMILFTVLFCGCTVFSDKMDTNNSDKKIQEEGENMDGLINKEYLLEYCGITPEQLEGIDVDTFIEEFDLRESNIGKVNVTALLEMFRENGSLSENENFKYEYLLNAEYENGTISKTDILDIQVVAFRTGEDIFQQTIILDEKEGKCYWAQTDLLHVWNEECVQRELNKSIRNKLYKLLEECQIFSWEKEYQGTNENMTGSFDWELYFEMKNGKMYRYSGSGLIGNNRPEQWDAFEVGLQKLFEE